jgi:AraC-like DNA-binding protein
VAKALLMSPRTLARRLDEEGTSFQVIKDELRRDVAIQLLSQTNLPPAEVGARTGFEDPTTFYRAFKRWTGGSPGVYRQARTRD